MANQLNFPLLVDKSESTGSLILTKNGGACRKDYGWAFDGYSARLMSNNIPPWLQSATGQLGFQCTLRPTALVPPNSPTRDYYVSLVDESGNSKASICLGIDLASVGHIYFGVNNASGYNIYPLGRPLWQYCGKIHETSHDGHPARCQTVLVLDDIYILYTVHFDNTLSRCYKVNRSTWQVVGQFDFPLTYTHVNGLTYHPDWGYWFGANGCICQFDLNASLSSGTAVITLVFHLDATGICFLDDGSHVYLVASHFVDGTEGQTYILNPVTIQDGETYNPAEHLVKWFANPPDSQSCLYANNVLYQPAYSVASGLIYELNIHTFLNSGSNGDSYTTFLNRTHLSPTRQVEAMSIDSTGYLWCGTEGNIDLGDDNDMQGLWRSKLTECPERIITVNFDGTKFTIHQQGILHREITITPSPIPTIFAIGGKGTTSPGISGNGFAEGYVKCIRLQDTPISVSDINSIAAGTIETRSLIPVVPALINPGAEAGTTTGWTNEVGGLGVRTVNPLPYAGNYYFYGGAYASTKSRQRVNLVNAGLDINKIDTGSYWAILVWKQANYDGLYDPGACGIRFLDSSQVQISENISEEIYVNPAKMWQERCYGIDIPSGARYLDILQKATRTGGTNLDNYIDNIELYIFSINPLVYYSVHNDVILNIETRTPIIVDSSFPVDYRIVSRNNLVLNIDYRNPIINVIREAVLPVEWVKQIINDVVTPIEIRNDQQFKLILVTVSFMGQN